MPDETANRIGRYEVRRELGRGSMGVVYEAWDPALGRTVAIKTIDLGFAVSEEMRKGFVQRFLAEARAAAALQHPNVVVAFDIGRDESGTLFLALEHLAGETLAAMLRRGPLDWRRAVEVARQLAEGLHHAHQAGIVHRDVKPANVMVLPSAVPKILDFGIAKLSQAEMTAKGQGFGSPAYMSPEQADGRPVDGRSDIFSLGSVLYEMIAGRRAFEGKGTAAVLMKLLHETPPPLRSLRPEVPRAVEAVVAKAMARDPAQRYADAGLLARALAAAAEEGVAAESPASAPRAAPGEGTAPAGNTLQSRLAGTGLPAGARVSLAALSGPKAGTVYRLEAGQVTLGRSGPGARAVVQIGDGEISRVHALVTCTGGSFELQDLGSKNGTFVGDERVQTASLEPGDEFRIGRTTLQLIVVGPDPIDP